jgi:hypothetical protein
MRWLDFSPLAEFVDRSGVTRSIYGCSLIGRFEFADRQEQLKVMLDAALETETWQDLYLNIRAFSTAVDRCLMLNGIEPDWLTPETIEQLLFARFEDGEWKAGWLTELNTRVSQPSTGESIESTLPNLLAIVSLNCESLSQAIDLASNMPGNLLLDTIDARNELVKTPEQKAEDMKAVNMAELRRDYAGLVSDPPR